jgi:hypothetical protein
MATATVKTIAGVGWTARINEGLIEDRYLISLQPGIVQKLQAGLRTIKQEKSISDSLVHFGYSTSVYRLQDPNAAWQAVQSVVLGQLDAVSAVIFKSALNSAFATYGVEKPEDLLSSIAVPVGTFRNSSSSRSIVFANIAVSPTELAKKVFGVAKETNLSGNSEFKSPDGESALGVFQNTLLLGQASEVETTLKLLTNESTDVTETMPVSDNACVVTYTNDGERVRDFVIALMKSKSVSISNAQLDSITGQMPMSITESSLTFDGIDRRTRSPLGQFGALTTMLLSQ